MGVRARNGSVLKYFREIADFDSLKKGDIVDVYAEYREGERFEPELRGRDFVVGSDTHARTDGKKVLLTQYCQNEVYCAVLSYKDIEICDRGMIRFPLDLGETIMMDPNSNETFLRYLSELKSVGLDELS